MSLPFRLALVLWIASAVTVAAQSAPPLPPSAVARFAELALECVHREYPNKIAHVLNSDADVQPPRTLTPAFYGCYDWHSSVHGHWLLARLARLYPDVPFAVKAREALATSLAPERVAGEVAYIKGPGRTSFERPYGLAWLLQLSAELREWNTSEAQEWARTVEPLEREAVAQLRAWMPKLSAPIRIGEHSQTAFSFSLILDWARVRGDREMEALLGSRIRDFYAKDRGCPMAYEPSGEDFLSPCIAEADLMRRVMAPSKFAAWLTTFLPAIPARPQDIWLVPAVVTDPTDPKLAHLDGLNLSRAWMLDGIFAGLPDGDPRRPAVAAAATAHREAGLKNVTGEHYEGGHWLGTFAVYLVTGRGLGLGR